MANFKTHLFVAASASGIAASCLYSNKLITILDLPWYIFLGTIGGLLPDIDSDNSHPLKLLFIALAILASMFSIVAYKSQSTLAHILMIACIAFFVVFYPIQALFKYFTVHRGVFHSLLSAVFFTLLTVYASHRLFHQSISFSWMNGLFIGYGLIIHLILDECFSVDLGNVKLKRSFGSAFKLLSLQYLHASVAMMVACVILYYYTPGLPFAHQEALTMINLAFDSSSSTLEKYFLKLTW